MSYKIIPTREFEKGFCKLDKNLQSRIVKKVDEIAENPERYKHLHYGLSDFCRIWVGKLRILFSYNLKDKILYLEKIVFDHRY